MNEYQMEKIKAMLRDNISHCYRSVSAGGNKLLYSEHSRIPKENIDICNDARQKYKELMSKDQLGDNVG
jgi:hypothetical protein